MFAFLLKKFKKNYKIIFFDNLKMCVKKINKEMRGSDGVL